MMAGIILKREPFFNGKDNFEMLLKISNVLGTDDIYEYISKYDLNQIKKL